MIMAFQMLHCKLRKLKQNSFETIFELKQNTEHIESIKVDFCLTHENYRRIYSNFLFIL